MKYLFPLLFVALLYGCSDQTTKESNSDMPVVQNYSPELDIDMIKDVMQAQQNAWNKGDLNQFMVGYWKSDSLMFIGKSGVNKGWDKILANYEKGYPDKETMGRLQFTNLSIEVHTPEIASVIGKWELFRSADTLSGHYSLLWKKLNQKWVIVSDHSS